MNARVLAYEEWSRLPDYMDPVLMTLRPGTSRMCVVEHDGEIIARWLLYPVLFAEDLWVHPNYRRKVSVGRKLWRLVQRATAELGFGRVVSTVVDEEIASLVAHLESETLPGRMVTYPMGGQ